MAPVLARLGRIGGGVTDKCSNNQASLIYHHVLGCKVARTAIPGSDYVSTGERTPSPRHASLVRTARAATSDACDADDDTRLSSGDATVTEAHQVRVTESDSGRPPPRATRQSRERAPAVARVL